MSNELQTKLDAILLDKNTNLLPENLKKGTTLLGVDGILETGLTEHTFQDSILTLENTIENGTIQNFTIAGRSRQNGTPSLDNPVQLTNQLAGDTCIIRIQNEDNTKSQSYRMQLTHTIKGRASVRDIFKDDGLHIRMGEETFDGSEDEVWKIWALNNDTVERFYINSDKLLFGESSMCDKLVYQNNNDADEHFRGSTTNQADGTKKYNQLVVFINKNRLSEVSIAGFKAYLAENPITLTAALQEEIIVPYNIAQQGTYDALKKVVTYGGTTHITTNYGSTGPMLSGKYYTVEEINEDMKLFETIEEMQNNPNAKEGDLAIVYSKKVNNATVDSQFSKATFPSKVVLPSAFTGDAYVVYRAVDHSIMFDCWGEMNPSYFNISCYSETGEVRIQYESSDGITYTRTDGGEETVDFGTEIYYAYTEYWNDAIGYFIQTGGMCFDGLYECNSYLDKSIMKFIPLSAVRFDDTEVLNDTVFPIWDGKTFVGEYVSLDKIQTIMQKLHDDGVLTVDKLFMYLFLNKNNEICTMISTGGSGKANMELHYNIDPSTKLVKDVVGISSAFSYKTSYGNATVYKLDLDNLTYTAITTVTEQPYTKGSETGYYRPYTDVSTCIIGLYLKDGVLGTNGAVGFRMKCINPSQTGFTAQNGIDSTLHITDDGVHATSNNMSGDEVYPEKRKYFLAPTQLTLGDASQLLPGKIAYGKTGAIKGDGTIYNNLDVDALNNAYGFGLSDTYISDYSGDGKYAVSYTPNTQGDKIVNVLRMKIPERKIKPNSNLKLDDQHILSCELISGTKTLEVYKTNIYTVEQTVIGTIDLSSHYVGNNATIPNHYTVWDYDETNNVAYTCIIDRSSTASNYISLKVDLNTNVVTFLNKFNKKYNGLFAISAKNQAVYLCMNTEGLTKNSFSGTQTTIKSGLSLQGDAMAQYRFIPCCTGTTYYIYDIERETFIYQGTTNIGGGGIAIAGNKAYCLPYSATTIHIYDMTTNAFLDTTMELSSNERSFCSYTQRDSFIQNGKVLMDANWATWMIDTVSNTVEFFSRFVMGICVAVDGKDAIALGLNGLSRKMHVTVDENDEGQCLAFKTSTGEYYYLRQSDVDRITEFGSIYGETVTPEQYTEAQEQISDLFGDEEIE